MTFLARPLASLALLLSAVPIGCVGNVDEPRTSMQTADTSTHVFDLTDYEGVGTPLRIANTTLVFPLDATPAVSKPSRSEPGNLLIAYTRVGCWITDPAAHVGTSLPGSPVPVRLRRIVIEQSASHPGDLAALAKETCFSYRDRDGVWHALQAPTTSVVNAQRSTSEIVLDVPDATAVAIFLPTYSNVWKVTYDARTSS